MDEELRNLINSLSVSNFRILVQELNKEKYLTPYVRIVDGPYDGGNDLEIIIQEKEIKKNIQITVQKFNIDQKIREDLEKAKKNSSKYGYLNKLELYTSQNITKSHRNSLQTMAEIEFGIDLLIIDATVLSNDSSEFSSIRKVTYKSHGIGDVKLSEKISKESKILFDVLTSNKNTVEIRKNLIYSFIYSFLFNNPGSDINEINNAINLNFQNKLDNNYLFNEINFLKSKGYVESPSDKKLYQLSKIKRQEIEVIQGKMETQEYLLNLELTNYIDTFSIKCTPAELIDKINQIYIENYQIDIDEVNNTSSSFSASLKKSYNDLQNFLKDKGVEDAETSRVAKDILTKCSEKEYLNKIAVTSLFTNLYNSDKLENYLNTKIQTVVLDTQILIRIICIYFKEDFDFRDIALMAVQSLLRTIDSNEERVQLVTTTDYIEEVAAHFQEALKLQRFLNLSFIQDFGVSKNVYYNVFKKFKYEGVIAKETELDEFIEMLLGIDCSRYFDPHFISDVTTRLIDIFEIAGVKVVSHSLYADYSNIKRDYEISLTYLGKDRSAKARDHDLRTILYLSSEDIHINKDNGELNEPFLLTWDSAFYDFRKTLLNKYRKFKYWYIYSPLKFVDRLSVMNFKISPNSITHNVVALAETNFNYSTKTSSFFDVISAFFNKEDVSTLSILSRLADLRKETQDLEGKQSENENIFDVQETPITKVLTNIKDHYSSYSEKNTFNDLLKIFENKELEETLIKILTDALSKYRSTSEMALMYSKLNHLITKDKA